MSKSSITGMDGLLKNLERLSKPKARKAFRQALRNAGEPLVDAAKAAAPVKTGGLRDSIKMSEKLTPAQSRKHRKAGRGQFEDFVGSASPLAHLVEFGTEHSAPQPFLGPVWDAMAPRVLESLRAELIGAVEDQVVKQNASAARKAAKAEKAQRRAAGIGPQRDASGRFIKGS